MPHATSAGAKIYWEEHGAGDPLLLIMGLGATLEWWQRLIPVFSASYRTIVYDNRGVGRSDVPLGPYAIPQMAEDAVAVMDAAGIASAHVFGASMGGMIAQELALNHPARVRSLILGCTACGGTQAVPAEKEVRAALGARSKMTREEAMWVMAPYIFDAGTLRERVAGLTMPTLVIHGETDRLVPAENGRIVAKAIPGSRLVMILAGQPHFLYRSVRGNPRGAVRLPRVSICKGSDTM